MEFEIMQLAVLFALLSSHGAFGKFSFIPEQNQKQTVQRPVIKTIRSSDGDIFDCVDIHQQPAFDHPLLKNHEIQLYYISVSFFQSYMKPSSYPVDVNSSSTSSGASSSSIVLNSLDCPSRTIPILRGVGGKNVTSNSYPKLRRGSSFRVADHTSNDPSIRGYWAEYLAGGYFYGVKAALGVYEPILIKGNIVSQASINLSNGKGSKYSAASAGWFVHPELYDSHTRLFVSSYDALKQPSPVCINLHCPWFVQVSSTIALGLKIHPVSQYNGPQFQVDLEIFKDPGRGDWWVVVGRDKKPIGYWPKEVFTSLGDQASIAFWGGYAESYANVPSPPMGSGHFGAEGFKKAAFVLGMQVVNRNRNLIAPLKYNCRGSFFTPKCYKPEKIRETAGEWGLNFFFGGPGGCLA